MLTEKRRRLFNIILFFSLIIFCVIGSYIIVQYVEADSFGFKRQGLDVYFFNVGQGDATMFYTTTREVILVDGGPDMSVLYELGKSLPFYERTIDLMILTHPDSDHLNGLLDVLERYQVKRIMYTDIIDNLDTYKIFKDSIAFEGAEIIIVKGGENFYFGELEVNVLYPMQSMQGKSFIDTNESSIALRLSYDSIDFLLTGDLPQEQEIDLIKNNQIVESEVMKAGHHGSKTSSAVEFLHAVNPQYAVISAGIANHYGHPHYRVLKNFENIGAHILRTDEEGTIHVYTNGRKVEIRQ
jgi:competence protein ComEC